MFQQIVVCFKTNPLSYSAMENKCGNLQHWPCIVQETAKCVSFNARLLTLVAIFMRLSALGWFSSVLSALYYFGLPKHKNVAGNTDYMSSIRVILYLDLESIFEVRMLKVIVHFKSNPKLHILTHILFGGRQHCPSMI